MASHDERGAKQSGDNESTQNAYQNAGKLQFDHANFSSPSNQKALDKVKEDVNETNRGTEIDLGQINYCFR